MERTLPSQSAPGIADSGLHGVSERWWRRMLTATRGRSQFVVNVLTNAGGNSLNSVMQLLLLLALGRLLGKDVYAAYLSAGAIIGIGEVASDFGTRLWAVRRFAGPEHPGQTLKYCFLNKLVFTLAAACILGLLPLNTLTFSALTLSVLVASTQPSSDPFLWFLRGKDRLDVEAGLVLSCRIAIVVALISAAVLQVPLSVLLLSWLSCNLVRMMVESRLNISQPLFDHSSAADINAGDVWKNVCDVLPIGISLILAPMFTQSALLFVTMIGSDEDVAQFGTAFKLVLAAGFIGTSIVVSSFARLAKAIQTEDFAAAQQIIRTKLLLVTAALAPICVLGTLLSVPIASTILKPDLASAGAVMVLLMPGLYLSCVNMGAKFTLNAFCLNRQDVTAMLAGFLVFFMVFAWSLSLPLPARGALSWTLGEATVLSCRLTFLKMHGRHSGIPAGLVASTVLGLAVLAGSVHLYY